MGQTMISLNVTAIKGKTNITPYPAAFVVDNIGLIEPNGSGSDVQYRGPQSIPQVYTVDESPSDIVALASSSTPSQDLESITAAITAHAGGGQASGTALTATINNITTCATAGDSVVLPEAVAGLVVFVQNYGAAAADVFPASGETINSGSADAAVALPVGGRIEFIASTTNNWTTEKAVTLFTDLVAAKEVNHAITVTDTSTAATAGGNIAVSAGKAGTSGTGGVGSLAGGVGGTTGTGGAVNVTSGLGGTTSGNSGAVNVKSGAETSTDSSGAVTVASGTTASATSGAVTVATGANSTSGDSGVLSVTSGASSTTGNTGTATLQSGNAASGTSGIATVTSGTGTTASGNAVVASGNATTLSGNISAVTGTGVTTGTATAGSGNATTTSGLVLIKSGTAATTTGKVSLVTGVATTTSGLVEVITGTGATTGAINLTTGAATTTGGAITIATGNTSAGTAGNIILSPGTSSTTTVAPIIIANAAVVTKPVSAPFFLIGTTASDGVFAKSIVGGYVEIRGATGNVQLPTGAQLTAAVGTVTSGSSFTCIFNAIGATPMTAGNTATITTNTNAVIDASVGSTLVTVTSTSNVNIAQFRFVWDSANWIVSRV